MCSICTELLYAPKHMSGCKNFLPFPVNPKNLSFCQKIRKYCILKLSTSEPIKALSSQTSIISKCHRHYERDLSNLSLGTAQFQSMLFWVQKYSAAGT
jgi:hypothetical protein